MPRTVSLVTALVLIAGLAKPSRLAAEDPARLVRDAAARTPAEERAGFHLPEGFEIQLFADDAQLVGKPINMAFDARGRLWVTCTEEYPFAVKKEKWSADTTRAIGSKDTIRILEDTDGDGHADKVTVFADDLNIPTGVQPYKNGCIAWSIPNILYLEDSHAAGNTKAPMKADKRSILFGPLGYEKDTHGMISSMRLGLDGWIYATHGFSNTSHFQVRPEHQKHTTEGTENTEDKDPKTSVPSVPSVVTNLGQSLDITSGSVFRFKPDGSAVELWTSGQVNPFGLCWDSWGNLYSADCHSSPIYQLIRGATYPQFGKPADALGFGPVMCEHAHGSTGIAGIIYLDGGVWGPEWDDHMFVGNPVTSKVNHDRITFTGSTPKANEQPDFITSDDGWFRPVDLQLGPDGALYIADFYNKIIGHYEIPLDDQRRDRSSGRIWRVVRKGFTGKLTECDLSKAKPEALVEAMGDNNLARRGLAMWQLASLGKSNTDIVHAIYKHDPSGIRRATGLWTLYRLHDSFSAGMLIGFSAYINEGESPSEDCFKKFPVTASHALKIVQDRRSAWGWNSIALLPGLTQQNIGPGIFTDPRLRREAFLAHAICETERAKPEDINPHYNLGTLVAALGEVDPRDTHLSYALRRSLVDIMKLPHAFKALDTYDIKMTEKIRHAFIELVLAVPTAEAASWLLEQIKSASTKERDLPSPGQTNNGTGPVPPLGIDHSLLIAALTHIARHLPAEREGELVELVQKHFGADLDTQLDLFAAVREGKVGRQPLPAFPGDRSAEAADPLQRWAAALASRLVDSLSAPEDADWSPTTPPSATNPSPWFRLVRPCADGKDRPMLDSHPPGGEKLTGILRSKTFDLPPKLSFWLAGHRGQPAARAHEKNFVRLVDADTDHEIALAFPPRHNTARLITWQTGKMPAKRAYLEIVDGDDGAGYAWLAAGGFEPAVVGIPDLGSPARDRRVRAAAELAAMTRITTEEPDAQRHVRPAFPELVKLISTIPHKETFSADTRTALAAASLWALWLWPREVMELARDPELAAEILSIVYSGPPEKSAELAAALRTLPSRAQVTLASALATSPETARALLAHASPRVVADPLVTGKLKALGDPATTQQLADILAKLPPQNDAVNALIASRLKTYDPAKADADRGKLVFAQLCVVCHRIGILGNLVGPQLDGIGARGAERLLEDILDPNRAVDPAFRLHIVKMKNGELMTGLLRRDSGDALVFADAAGQEHTVKKSDMTDDQTSEFSLMPAGLGEVFTEAQIHDLLKFLLDRKS